MADLSSAAFRTGLFSVTYKGLELEVRTESAREWLESFGRGTWVRDVRLMVTEESYDLVLDAAANGHLTDDDVLPLARTIMAVAAGRPWWEAERLVASLWPSGGRLLGTLVLAGVDPARLTLAAYCSAVWAQLTKGADTEQMMKLESQLQIPPPGVTPDEMEAFDDGWGMDVNQLRSMPGMSVG